MSENENTEKEVSGLQKRFDAYCCSVIRKRAFKQIGKYIQYCKKYAAIPVEEMEELTATEEENPTDKFIFVIEGEQVYIEDEFLADAISELQERMRNVLLLNVALEHNLSEIASMLDIRYNTVKVYKSLALREIRRKAGVEHGEKT